MIDADRLLGAAGFVPEQLIFPSPWCGHLPFASWLVGELRPASFVELGTHAGNSYLGFCQSVAEQALPVRCHAVDTWQGDAHAGHYGETVYAALRRHHDPAYGAFSKLLRMTFDEALPLFEDNSIGLLHIDGLHTYEAVRHDFETWQPKLAPGAIVLFHDTHVKERNFGVWQFWEELRERYPLHLSFAHSNGLGVLQVGGEPLSWLKQGSADQKRIVDYFTSLGESMMVRFQAREMTGKIAFLEEQIAARDAQLAARDAQLAARDAQIAELHASTSWKITRPVRWLGSRIGSRR